MFYIFVSTMFRPTFAPSLIIVESPAKCAKIEKYLGAGYKCMASYGHIRELPSLECIDIDNRFQVQFKMTDNKVKLANLEKIKKAVRTAREVILATDDDREGEAIAWHLCEVLGLNVATTQRIVFHEVTEKALTEAIRHPRTIHMPLVSAQRTRQILDVLVGFKVSPALWKFISKPKGRKHVLSAGRCQSPALKLVYEHSRKRETAVSQITYCITGTFTPAHISFPLSTSFDSEEDVVSFLSESARFSHTFHREKATHHTRTPPRPFTTSRLQQSASNSLHFSPKETMSLCQTLYENGYITYMRTDSSAYSEEFWEMAKHWIERHLGEDFFFHHGEKETPRTAVKTNTADADAPREAHEAIRPTNLDMLFLPDEMGVREKRMYQFIWKNAVESCSTSAQFSRICHIISAPQGREYKLSVEQPVYEGWLKVGKYIQFQISSQKEAADHSSHLREEATVTATQCDEGLDADADADYEHVVVPGAVVPYEDRLNYLSLIPCGSEVSFHHLHSTPVQKGILPHYTEAKLVRLLEEKGIGRPSTFSSLVDKIQERGYVKVENVAGTKYDCKEYSLHAGKGDIDVQVVQKEFGAEKRKVVIQPLGVVVMEFLNEHFAPLFRYEYTSAMECGLDAVAKEEQDGVSMCASCNAEVDALIGQLNDTHKMEYVVDEQNTYIIGRNGPVLRHVEEKEGKELVSFHSVKKDLDKGKLERGEYEAEDIVDDETNDLNDPTKSRVSIGRYEDKELFLRKGKYGWYALWGKNTRSLRTLGNRPIVNVRFEEVVSELNQGSKMVREISANLSIRRGERGDYLYYKTPKMKKPIFKEVRSFATDVRQDYRLCRLDVLKVWAKEKYGLE